MYFMRYLQRLSIFFIISFLSLSAKAQQTKFFFSLNCLRSLDCVQQAIAEGVEVNARIGPMGYTSLHHALDLEVVDIAVIQALLKAEADVDASDSVLGRKPLHIASMNTDGDVAQALIDADAKVDAPDFLGRTSLHVASSWGSLPVAQVLLNAKAEVNATTNRGWRPLDLAIFGGHVSIIELLLSRGAEAPEVGTFLYSRMMELLSDGQSS